MLWLPTALVALALAAAFVVDAVAKNRKPGTGWAW